MSSYLGKNDETLPVVSKPTSQQYDPYSIYDVHCVDITSQRNGTTETNTFVTRKLWTIAVQAYHITPILCDFNQIIRDYP